MNDTPEKPADNDLVPPTVPAIPFARMPKEIAKGIIEVKKHVKKLGYDEENRHNNYDYVSIDKFLDVIGRLEAEAGIFCLLDETSVEVRAHASGDRVSSWLHVEYDVYLGHESGTMFGPLHRKIIVVASGAQAFGSAQSYLLKQFQRALYSVPTGEKDADADAQPGIPANRTPPPAQRPQETRAAAPKTEEPQKAAEPPKAPTGMSADERDTHNKTYNDIRKAIAATRSSHDIRKLKIDTDTQIRSLEAVGFGVAAQKLRESIEARIKALEPQGMGDPRQDEEQIPT